MKNNGKLSKKEVFYLLTAVFLYGIVVSLEVDDSSHRVGFD